MKNLICFAFILLITLPVISQKEIPEKVSPIKISGVYINTGVQLRGIYNSTLNDFHQLAPTSDLLQNDYSKYNRSDGQKIQADGGVDLMVEIKFRDQTKKKYRNTPLLRLGLSYSSQNILSYHLQHETRTPFDTLTSNHTNQIAYTDSIYSQNVGAEYTSEQLRLNGALIFSTDPTARWALYGGIGISAGISLNAHTSVYYLEGEATTTRFLNSNQEHKNLHSSNYKYSRELIKNKTNFGASAYIPLGVDFRLGKRKAFWKRIHLFYEMRPAIQVNVIPELNTVTYLSLRQGVGLRVAF